MNPAQQVTQEKCPDCPGFVPYSAEECPVCKSRTLGFPNVRWAERPAEKSHLARRFAAVEARAVEDGRAAEVAAFKTAVEHSDAVMNRSLAALDNWVSEQNPFFLSFHRQVLAGRVPNGTEWDEQRGAAEQTINPWCYLDLNYAALSLNRSGMTYYGDYTVVLNRSTVGHRSSVFEENPFYFNRRHGIYSGDSPPFGFRASWANRAILATAKLGDRVIRGATSSDFANLLMEQDGAKADCDFVEVHIHGSIHWRSIECVIGPPPARQPDKLIWRRLRRVLTEAGAKVEQVG